MNPETPERFVDADEAAKFLSLTRRRVLDLARAGKLPGHPIGRRCKANAAVPPERNRGCDCSDEIIWVFSETESAYGSTPRGPPSCKESGDFMGQQHQKGWLTKFVSKRNGWTWVYHFYKDKPETGKRVENTVTLGPVSRFPREKDAWAEVERRHLTPNDGQDVIGRVTFAELVANYRQKSFSKLRITTQGTTAHILDNYLLPRWGDSFALEINPDEIEEWLGALVLANPTREKIRRVMNVVYRRGQKSRMLPMTEDGNPVRFVTQSSKSNYKAVIVSPEQAFRIMMELEEPYRTLVFLVAVTGLRISEALGLKWGDLDYEREDDSPAACLGGDRSC